MANLRPDPVGYRPFRTQPLLAEGLLAVARPGGELLDRVSSALFKLADEAGAYADRQAERQGRLAGERAALEGRATIDVPEGKPGQGTVRGVALYPNVAAAIDRAAEKHGVDAATLKRIADIESSGNPRAKNPRSSAGGLFQQVDANARQYGVADRFDPDQSADGAARFMRDNRAYLRRQLGREPTPGELYLAHQQGPGGAAKLLRNPEARASSLVGADAVRLNGGSPGMTAAQFSRLWIDKVETGYTLPEEGGPPQISGGTWRPVGEDTIYGRAYNEAGARTYVATLEQEMRSTTAQLYDRYRDDPDKLAASFKALHDEQLRDHVFPEIAADYETGFGRLADSYLQQARQNRTDRLEAEERAGVIERTSELETERDQRIAATDPTAPNAADALASTQAAIDANYDDAVARQLMAPADAATAKQRSRREGAIRFYGRQADAMDADGVKSLRETMAKDFADGGIEGLDGDGWQTLEGELTKLENQKRLEAARQETDFRQRGDLQAARVAAGLDVDSAALSKLALDAKAAPGGQASMTETYAKISAARTIRDFSVRKAEEHIKGLRTQYGRDATPAQLRTLAFAEEQLAAKKQAIATDAVTHAEQQGLVPTTPLLTEAQPDQLPATVAARIAAGQQAAKVFGVTPRYLKAGEAKAVADLVKGDPARGVAIAGAIVAGAGRDAPAVLKEFGGDAPMIEDAGAIIAFGGSARAAQDVIAGNAAKAPDGQAFKPMKAEAQRENFRAIAGGSLALAPRDQARIMRAGSAIAKVRIAEAGVAPDSEEAIEIHTRAVNEAAGAVYDRGVQFGGFADAGGGWFSTARKVLVPSSIRADRMDEVIAAITDADLAVLPIKPAAATEMLWQNVARPKGLASMLKDATPVAVAGGYAFAAGDPDSDDPQWIAGEDGRIFVLDLAGMRDRLAPRVPGAFRE